MATGSCIRYDSLMVDLMVELILKGFLHFLHAWLSSRYVMSIQAFSVACDWKKANVSLTHNKVGSLPSNKSRMNKMFQKVLWLHFISINDNGKGTQPCILPSPSSRFPPMSLYSTDRGMYVWVGGKETSVVYSPVHMSTDDYYCAEWQHGEFFLNWVWDRWTQIPCRC
jgi:hypothetical protein